MSFVQSASGLQPSGATLTVPYTSALTAGHCLLAVIRLSSGSDTFSGLGNGVADATNGDWTRIGRIVHTSGSLSSLIYKLPSNASTSALSVVFTNSNATAAFRAGILEYTESDVDTIATPALLTTNTTLVSPSVTAKANASVVGLLSIDSGTTTFTGAGSPSSVSRLDLGAADVADLTSTTSGGYTVSWTLGATKAGAAFTLAMQTVVSNQTLFGYYRNLQ